MEYPLNELRRFRDEKWLGFGITIIMTCLFLCGCSSGNITVEFEKDCFAFKVSPETILALGKAHEEAFKEIEYFSGSGTITDIRTTQQATFPDDHEGTLYIKYLEITLDDIIRLDIPLGPINEQRWFFAEGLQKGDIIAFEGEITGLTDDKVWVKTEKEDVKLQSGD